MLKDFTRSAIVVAPKARRVRAAKLTAPIASAVPTGPDLDECSLDNLAELADLAYRAGDRESAEYFARRLYALHDCNAKRAAEQQTAAEAQPSLGA